MEVVVLTHKQRRLQEANAREDDVIADRREKTSNFCFMVFFVVMSLCLLGLAWHLEYVKGNPVLMTMSSVMLQYRCPEVSLVNVLSDCSRCSDTCRSDLRQTQKSLVKQVEINSRTELYYDACARQRSKLTRDVEDLGKNVNRLNATIEVMNQENTKLPTWYGPLPPRNF